MDTNEFYYRYQSFHGFHPGNPMEQVDVDVHIVPPKTELEISVEIQISESASYSAGEIKATVLSPVLIPSPVQDGIDLVCLEEAEPPFISLDSISVFDRGDQTWIARQIKDLYQSSDKVKSFFLSLPGEVEVPVSIPPDDTEFGGLVVAKQRDSLVVLKIGTTTAGQLVRQGTQILEGPKPQGGYTTIPIWAGVATRILQILGDLDLRGISKIFLAGHSLGGAACTMAAVFLNSRFPELRLGVLTYGSPKPGGVDTSRACAKFSQARIENEGDPIPYIPPRREDLSLVSKIAIGPVITNNLDSFKPPPGRILLMGDGSLVPGSPEQPEINLIEDLILAWLVGLPGPAIADHGMGEYLARLEVGF